MCILLWILLSIPASFVQFESKPIIRFSYLLRMLGEGAGRRITSLSVGFWYFIDLFRTVFCFAFCFWWRNIFISSFGDYFSISRLELQVCSLQTFSHWAKPFNPEKGFFKSLQPIFYSLSSPIPCFLILPTSNQKDLCFKEKPFSYCGRFGPTTTNSILIFALDGRDILVSFHFSRSPFWSLH